MNKNKKDHIYSNSLDQVSNFVFDEQVANVFDDMINRSVPGYQNIIAGIGVLAQRYAQENSVCYDLGCSLGASTLIMRQCIEQKGVRIVSVDNSEAMVKHCQENVKKGQRNISVEVVCDDIKNVEIKNASMVVLNFVLQFINPVERCALLKNIYEGMEEGGVLILSEKITFQHKDEQEFLVDMHHAFKKMKGYSDLEISQKRTALENVLVPETFAEHNKRLKEVGFHKVYLWFQYFNFVSILAIK
ncbi:tRNA (cmo5U34)-methyltransferase [hydrothermal vent metagenome]|uniref:tRNA (Cmo5U34)-methyltransferase n=1 Tax=hydrothermal vent metagenome TaxID=652676 RepID=A0A3B1DAP8_9ZZZZ